MYFATSIVCTVLLTYDQSLFIVSDLTSTMKNKILKESLRNELKGITAIGLASQAPNILEKALWLLIGLTGTIWAFYFIGLQFQLWNDDASIITKGM